MEPEVVMNLWVFVQAVGPLHLIYQLGVRPYVLTGSDDEKTSLLKTLSISDFHFARRFALPARYYVRIKEDDGGVRASSGDSEPESGGKVRKGVALVRPDISGMHQMEYFKEALDAVEKSLPTLPLSAGGPRSRPPNVNRGNLLSVITTVNVDDKGNQVARVESPYKSASPTASLCLWLFNDAKAGAIYAVSGRGYMLHGSQSDKTRILKSLAPYDFSMVSSIGTTKGMAIGSNEDSYNKELFKNVFHTIEQEIPGTIGIDGKIRNPVTLSVRDSTSIATRVTLRADGTADTINVQVNASRQVATTVEAGTVRVSLATKKSFIKRLFGK